MQPMNSRGPYEVISVERRVYLESALGCLLDAIGHCLGDDRGPLVNGAPGDSYCASDGGPVVIEERKNGGFQHDRKSTAC
jgi:hypothetical protein